MRDLYLFETDKVHMHRIKEICTRYSVKRNVERAVKEQPVIDVGCWKSAINSKEISLYLVRGYNGISELGEAIIELNPDNYTVLIAEKLSEIIEYICASFRPAGVLMKPAQYSDTEKIFDDIYSDYNKTLARPSSVRFRFKIRSQEFSVSMDKILYLEAANKKMLLCTEGQTFEFYMSSEDILKQLPDTFLRIHKSFIVNADRIKLADFKNMSVTLDDDSEIYISRTYKNVLSEFMKRRKSDTARMKEGVT